MRHRWKLAAMGCLLGAVASSGFVPAVRGADDKSAKSGDSKSAKSADGKSADSKGAKGEEAEFKIKLDPYLPPPGVETKALRLYISRLTNLQCPAQTKEGFLTHLEKIDKSLVEVLSRKVETEIQIQASDLRFEVLSRLSELEIDSANTRREKLLNGLMEDSRPEVATFGKRLYIFERLQTFDDLKPAEVKELFEDVTSFLKNAKELAREHVVAGQDLAIQLEGKQQYDKALAAYTAFHKIASAKTGAGADAAVDVFQAGMMRVGMLGKKITFKGTTLEGDAFDLAKLKGKVVLIDFWATWCIPCKAEIPNFKKQYELYHDKGFEVVGISLDEKPEDAKDFIHTAELPWVTLMEPKEADRQWNTPACKQFGVRAIPGCFLIDQSGTVVSISAKGEELNSQLAKLLGPVKGKTPAVRQAREEPTRPTR